MGNHVQVGYLTVYSADQSEIYGEFADAERVEDCEGPSFRGVASDGTLATFHRLNADGIEHVFYKFEGNPATEGNGRLLRPLSDSTIIIEPL